MHVLIIHQAFVTGQEAGGTRHYELAQHLIHSGHHVSIIASTASYLTGKPFASAPSGWILHEQVEGIDLYRTWTYAALHRSFFHRMLGFLSFMLSSFVGALRVRHVDCVWGTSPPLFQALTAYAVARLKRVPLLFEVRDLWPDFAIETGVLRQPLFIRGARALEHFLYRHADAMMVNSPGFIPHLRECGVPEAKIHLVENGVELEMFDPADRAEEVRREFGLTGKFVALYAGAQGIANDLPVLLRAAQELLPVPEITFVLVGDGKEHANLVLQAQEWGLNNVCFIPAQPKTRMPALLAASDLCIAILQPIPMFTTTYPNKVFDYMAAGRPTLLAIGGVIRDVIQAADGGVYVAPGDAHALADAVRAYWQHPEQGTRQGALARAYVAAHFDRREQSRKLEAVLKRVCGQ